MTYKDQPIKMVKDREEGGVRFEVYEGGSQELFIRVTDEPAEFHEPQEVCLDYAEARALHEWLTEALRLPAHVEASPNE